LSVNPNIQVRVRSENQTINTPIEQHVLLKITKHQKPAFSPTQQHSIYGEISKSNGSEPPKKNQKRSAHFIKESPAIRDAGEHDFNKAEIRYCPNCGNIVDKHDKFCIFCGCQLLH
jgi:hypothetical protein